MVVNKHGLSRSVPRDVKTAVRTACGFGCVICGAVPYEYDHFKVPFSEAKAHDPDDIVLLCDKHHREKTNGLIDNDLIEAARRVAPLDRPAHFRLSGTHTDFGVHWPTLEIEPTMHGVVVDDQPILQFEASADELEPVLISGILCGRDAQPLCVIERNEILVRPKSVGDFFLSANRFTFRDASRKKTLQFSLDAHGLKIEEIAHARHGCMIVANEKGLWVCNGARTIYAHHLIAHDVGTVVEVQSQWVRDYEKEDISKEAPFFTVSGVTIQGGRAAIGLGTSGVIRT